MVILNSKYIGTIKCTYVELFDKTGKALFSLQAANFGKEQPVCMASSIKETRVPVTVSEGVKQVLEVYVNGILRTEQGVSETAKNLLSHFAKRGKIYQLKDTKFYVKPSALNWTQPIPGKETPEPDNEPESKNNKSKIAIIAAIALALLGN